MVESLKYDVFRKLLHQLIMPYIQIMSPRADLRDTCQWFGMAYSTKNIWLRQVREKLLQRKYKTSRRTKFVDESEI